jgi:D-sedoheptulose 7-phosphate isomerase
MDYTRKIGSYLKSEIEVLQKIDYSVINEVMNVLEAVRERGCTVYICGNGGSAATASHFACDFNKGVSFNQDEKYNFICLSDNIPTLMALANDCGYEQIFVKQIEGKLKAGDALICISGSGNSPNVLLAAEYAKARGNTVIGITGYNGGKLYKLSDYRLHVAIDNMQIAEDVHMIFDHLIMWVMTH